MGQRAKEFVNEVETLPLYEYRCKQCGHVYEKIQSYTAADGPCPRCAGDVERLLSAPAIQFKGSGFYLTDYGKSGAGATKTGGSGNGAESGSATSGESGKSAEGSKSAAPASGGSSEGSSSSSSDGTSSGTSTGSSSSSPSSSTSGSSSAGSPTSAPSKT